jgi:transcriptional regulator with XRE-family HTH domain
VTPAEIGARVRAIRRRRGMSLDVAAGLAGISRSYLAMLERGERRFDRRGLLENVAVALGCSPVELTGQPYPAQDRATAEALAALTQISIALYDCSLADVPDLPARPVAELVGLAHMANVHTDESKYAAAAAGLGAVLTELHVHAVTNPDRDERRAALAALVEACFAAAGSARQMGRPELAVHAAQRAADAVDALGSPALRAFASMTHCGTLTRLGARRRARHVLGAGLAAVEPDADPSAADPAAAEGMGMLHLAAAQAAAREGNQGEADQHLQEAAELADATGERNSLRFHFGPTNTAAWSLAIAVELERGPSVAEQLDGDGLDARLHALRSADRRAGLHLDLARAWAQSGGDRDSAAVRHLDAADRIAPIRLRHDPIARELVAALDMRARRRVWELDSLRHRFGLATG